MDDQPPPIGVLIVDDHLMVRYGLKALLALAPDLAVIGEVADGEEAFAYCCDERPDVILMDIMMARVDGPTATARIRAAFPEVQSP